MRDGRRVQADLFQRQAMPELDDGHAAGRCPIHILKTYADDADFGREGGPPAFPGLREHGTDSGRTRGFELAFAVGQPDALDLGMMLDDILHEIARVPAVHSFPAEYPALRAPRRDHAGQEHRR
jgi:hypothetical protein